MNPPREDSVRRAESEIRDVIDAIPAMVMVDGNHAAAHVLQEMRVYAPLRL